MFIRKFKKKFKGTLKKEEKFRVNEKIEVSQVRVVDSEGGMVGVMSVTEAIALAEDKGMDLVEIAPKASPPTCKIMDYGKWKFKMSKKEKSSRKNQVKIIIKEIQLRPRTDVHDLQIKMKKALEFLLNGWKVKIHLRYSGREMAHKELGLEMLEKVKKAILPYSVLEKEEPQMERRSAFLFFNPDPVKIKEQKKKDKIAVELEKPSAVGKSADKVVAKEGEKTDDAEPGKAADEVVGKEAEKTVDTVTEKAAGKIEKEVKAAENEVGKTADKAVAQPADKAAGKVATQTVDKAAGKVATQTVDKAAGKAVAQTVDKAAGKVATQERDKTAN